MKFKTLCFFVALLFLIDTKAQNLVPNPSFEEYSECPTLLDGMHYVNHWYKSIQYPEVKYFQNPSPDYFHECAEGTILGVPGNAAGHQYAYDGLAYAGLYVFDNNNPNSREIIGVELANTLIPNVEYFINLRINLASSLLMGWASGKIGVKLTTNELFYSTVEATDNFAHLIIDEIIIDTTEWILLQGSFIADQPYQYLHIGSFFDSTQNTVELFGELPLARFAYYYIDDVYLSDEPLVTHINSSNNKLNFEPILTPNPATSLITVDYKNEPISIQIYNSEGKHMYYQNFENGSKLLLNIENYSKGLYLMFIQDYNGEIHSIKFIKI